MGLGLIPGQGTKILQAVKQKERKKKKYIYIYIYISLSPSIEITCILGPSSFSFLTTAQKFMSVSLSV